MSDIPTKLCQSDKESFLMSEILNMLMCWHEICYFLIKLKTILNGKFIQRFLSNITLTSDQQEDAQTKYTGVCEKLYKFYYGEGAYDSSKKYLFGSYKTKTNVRPFTEEQDIDVLFKIPEDTFKNMMAIRVTDNALCFKK